MYNLLILEGCLVLYVVIVNLSFNQSYVTYDFLGDLFAMILHQMAPLEIG